MTVSSDELRSSRAPAWTEVAPDPLVAIDAQGAVLWGNLAAEKLFGWELVDAKGMNAMLLVHPDDLWEATDSLRTTLERPLEPGTLITVRLRRADDAYVPCEVRGVNMLADPAVGAIILGLRDVSDRKEFASARDESQRRFEAVARHASEVLLLLDGASRVQWVSPALTPATGWTTSEVLGRKLARLVHPSDQVAMQRAIAQLGPEPGTRSIVELRMTRIDGGWRQCELLFVDMLADPDVGRIAVYVRDVSDRKDAEARQVAADLRFRSAFENAPIGMAVVALDGAFQQVNAALCTLLGYERSELGRLTLGALAHPEDRDTFAEQVAALLRSNEETCHFEHRLLRSDGRVVWVRLGLSIVYDEVGGAPYVISQVEDVTGRRHDEERLTYQALHDALTGMPNRALLMDRLEQALERARRGGPLVAVLFCDLDRFKNVNDSLGHQAGDRLLVSCARRLRRVLRSVDTVARFGGDEFVVLCTDVSSRSEVWALVRRISEVVQEPFTVDGTEIHVSTSVGIAFSDDGSVSAQDLLRDADAAMYRAKDDGRARAVVFEPELRSRIVERVRTESELRRAIRSGGLCIHVQPVVHIDGGLVGAEVLVRWPRDDTLFMPSQFVSLAEECGLISPLGEWVLDQACRELARWCRPGHVTPDDFRLMVNLSLHQLDSPGFAHTVAQVAHRHGVEPARICFELTESALAQDHGVVADSLRALRALGCGLAIDDFGTGYSALAHLKQFPFDALKIDRTFVAGIADGDYDDVIVSAMVRIADALGLSVIAEGVETSEQAVALRRHGVRIVQGFLFGRPVPPDEFARSYLLEPRLGPTRSAERSSG